MLQCPLPGDCASAKFCNQLQPGLLSYHISLPKHFGLASWGKFDERTVWTTCPIVGLVAFAHGIAHVLQVAISRYMRGHWLGHMILRMPVTVATVVSFYGSLPLAD